ncbi:hypothetical protein RHMOL_Rhmol03G0086100 [Rhododendron molle]|uniref:Uncharacterized protein n=1 Tax=Rhododendron molle TaxID=49168 RepID=A0ACC0PDI4_RHOML|nr:hypothetical protein RHMOL_Rhmol03G0086100 [Rhododendron molle]
MRCTAFEPSDRASDCSDLISATNDRESFIVEMRSEPSNDVCSTVLRTLLHNTIPKLNK